MRPAKTQIAQADQSLRWLPLDTWLYTEPPADPDQTARIAGLSEYLLGALGILCEILCPAQIMYILNCASSGYRVHVQMKQSILASGARGLEFDPHVLERNLLGPNMLQPVAYLAGMMFIQCQCLGSGRLPESPCEVGDTPVLVKNPLLRLP